MQAVYPAGGRNAQRVRRGLCAAYAVDFAEVAGETARLRARLAELETALQERQDVGRVRKFTERCPECNAVTVRYCRTCWKPQDTCNHAGNYERRVVSAYENGQPVDWDKHRGELIGALHDGDAETEAGNITSSGDFADYLIERLPWLLA